MLRAFNTLYAEYEIIKNLKFKTTFSYDYTTVKVRNGMTHVLPTVKMKMEK